MAAYMLVYLYPYEQLGLCFLQAETGTMSGYVAPTTGSS